MAAPPPCHKWNAASNPGFNKLSTCPKLESLGLLRRGFPQAQRSSLARGRAPSDQAQTTSEARYKKALGEWVPEGYETELEELHATVATNVLETTFSAP